MHSQCHVVCHTETLTFWHGNDPSVCVVAGTRLLTQGSDNTLAGWWKPSSSHLSFWRLVGHRVTDAALSDSAWLPRCLSPALVLWLTVDKTVFFFFFWKPAQSWLCEVTDFQQSRSFAAFTRYRKFNNWTLACFPTTTVLGLKWHMLTSFRIIQKQNWILDIKSFEYLSLFAR